MLGHETLNKVVIAATTSMRSKVHQPPFKIRLCHKSQQTVGLRSVTSYSLQPREVFLTFGSARSGLSATGQTIVSASTSVVSRAKP